MAAGMSGRGDGTTCSISGYVFEREAMMVSSCASPPFGFLELFEVLDCVKGAALSSGGATNSSGESDLVTSSSER